MNLEMLSKEKPQQKKNLTNNSQSVFTLTYINFDR